MKVEAAWAILLQKNVNMSAKHAKYKTCAGACTLTVEAHVVQDELLELGKDCHVRCNGPAQRVTVQIELFQFCEWRK